MLSVLGKQEGTKNVYHAKKDSNVIPVSFKQNAYEQKLKTDILVESANVGFSTWVKHVCAVYLYNDNSDKIGIFASTKTEKNTPNNQSKEENSLTSGINLDV